MLQNWKKLSKKTLRKHSFLVADVFVEIITELHYKEKKIGWAEVLADVFLGGALHGIYTPVCSQT
jgi:hypothetical protein